MTYETIRKVPLLSGGSKILELGPNKPPSNENGGPFYKMLFVPAIFAITWRQIPLYLRLGLKLSCI